MRKCRPRLRTVAGGQSGASSVLSKMNLAAGRVYWASKVPLRIVESMKAPA